MNNRAVLFIVNSLNNGGAERVCVNLAEECIKQGYLVEFIVLGKTNLSSAYKINKKSTIYNLGYDLSKRSQKIKCALFGWRKINKIIRDKNYVLVTSHLPLANFVTRFSAIGKKSIYVFHSTMNTFSKNKSIFFKLILRWFFKNRKITCVSNGIKDECNKIYGLNPKFIQTIYNPIDTEQILRKSKEPIFKQSKPYMLVVGRLNKLKRHDRALEIFKKGNFYKKYLLVFCGTGELEEKIKDKVSELNLRDNVIFLGWQENIYKWIKNAELLLCTSDQEGFPMNLVEAFACETKVVSSDCDFGPSEILTGDFAEFLTEKNNIDEYVKKINLALKKYPKTRNQILDKCKSENIVKEYIEFYGKEIK